jgi:ethanolaminephosphotransferase
MEELSWSSTLFQGPYHKCPSDLEKLADIICSIIHVVEVRKENRQNPLAPLKSLLPFFATWTLVPIYLYQQPIILNHHLIPFTFYVGLINAYSVGQIIIAHLTKSTTFPQYNVLTFPLALAVLDSAAPALGLWPSVLGDGTYQIAFVLSCLGLAIGVYGSFVVSPILSAASRPEAEFW